VKYGTAEIKVGGAWTMGDLIFLGHADYGKSTHGTLPLTDLFSLGGPRNLAAFGTGQLRGDDYTYASVDAQYKLTKPIPLLGLQIIAGVQAETGRMKKLVTEPTLSGWQNSFGAYLATNSAFGPMYLGIADSKSGKPRFYFFIGTP
jgi:NTE family protein